MKKLLLLFISTVTALFSYAQPQANFSFSSNCMVVAFTDLSTCNGCTITNWSWDFQDGNLINQQNLSHYFGQPGTYNVTLTVTDNLGNWNDTTMAVSVDYCPLQIQLTSYDDSCCYLLDAGSGYTSYWWSTGASTQSTLVCSAGTHTVYAQNANGETYSGSIQICFFVHPFSTNTTCSDNDGIAGLSIPLFCSQALEYLWSPGGETDSIITGLSPGTYTVAATDTGGCVQNYSVDILDSCWVITGRVFNDVNGNGLDDAEPGIAGVPIQTNNGISTGVSNSSGSYYIILPDSGDYDISPLNFPQFYSQCFFYYLTDGIITLPVDSVYSLQINSGNVVSSGNDFGFMPPINNCGTISGHVFNDENQNGIEDNGENGYNAVNIRITNSSGQSIIAQADYYGDYSASVPANDTYTVSVILNNTSFYCNYSQSTIQTFPANDQDYTVTLTTGSPDSQGNDFGVFYTPGFDAGVYSIWAVYGMNAGRPFNTGMDYKIFGTLTGTCTLHLEFDPLITFNYASITPDVIGSNYLEWIYDSNTQTPFWNCMSMNFTLDSSATAGQQLVWTGYFSCTDNDACPANDTIIRTHTVQSGPLKMESTYPGPISKEVLHTGNQVNGDITHADSTFSYIISFQNTTPDTVCSVIIIDELSPYLDITTMSQPFAMHTQHVEQQVPNSQTIVWIFDNLVLTDTASDYENSYGFVQYNIRMKPNLPIGTIIENRAWVIFNYGDSIATNIVSNKIVATDSYPENNLTDKLRIYPNPTTNILTIETQTSKGIYQLQDVTGKVLLTGSVTATRFNLDISALSKGIYLLSLVDGEQQVHRKIIKE